MRYFGFNTYLFSTQVGRDFETQYPSGCTGDITGRCTVYGSLTDAINPYRINSIDENYIFDKPFALIMTSSMTTENIVKQQLIQYGFPQQAINTLSFPAKQLNLSSHLIHSDSVSFLARIASETSNEAQNILNEYINITKNGEPFMIYRYTMINDKKHILNNISNTLHDYEPLIERHINPYGYQNMNSDINLEKLLQLVLSFTMIKVMIHQKSQRCQVEYHQLEEYVLKQKLNVLEIQEMLHILLL
eukprot:133602_1